MLDAGAGEHRAFVRSNKETFFLKQTAFTKMLIHGDWETAIKRFEQLDTSPDGLDFARRKHAKMILDAAQGSWDLAEEEAVSLLALRGGVESDTSADLVLFAASLSQRDYDEAKPRYELLSRNSHDGVTLMWLSLIHI